MQNWKQLELFDEDGEIFYEVYICVGGVEYTPKIVHPEDTFEACNNCEFTDFIHACMKAKCVPGERQDQQEVIWVRKYD